MRSGHNYQSNRANSGQSLISGDLSLTGGKDGKESGIGDHPPSRIQGSELFVENGTPGHLGSPWSALGMSPTNGLGLLSHLFRRFHNRLDDFFVSCAAANISLHKLDDILLGWARILFKKRLRRKDHPGGAKAALKATVLDERLL